MCSMQPQIKSWELYFTFLDSTLISWNEETDMQTDIICSKTAVRPPHVNALSLRSQVSWDQTRQTGATGQKPPSGRYY